MSNRYNYFYFEAEFKKYLIAGNAEPSTIKSYLSDLHYFFSWVQNTLHITDLASSDLPEVFSHSLIRSYGNYLKTATNAESTATRRLATLHKFFLFCIEQRWMISNPTDEFDKQTRRDEREEIVETYRKTLLSKQFTQADLERHINVIRDLVINSHLV